MASLPLLFQLLNFVLLSLACVMAWTPGLKICKVDHSCLPNTSFKKENSSFERLNAPFTYHSPKPEIIPPSHPVLSPNASVLLNAENSGLWFQMATNESDPAYLYSATLYQACYEGKLKTSQDLVLIGAELTFQTDSDGTSHLHAAAFHGHFETVRWLLQSGGCLLT
eukprot:TRINITY_DN314_c0_g1_i1.p1 TRINITY_DN314_c0_g1~~TRINITY_DN314_c0_g1_i1.p1  ORF type:complete len:167 (-),score=19.12 TRINITY_DN314_c0_g1_i1:134-634(-)